MIIKNRDSYILNSGYLQTFLLLLLLSCITFSAPVSGDEVVAEVNGKTITKKQLSKRARIDHLFMTLRGAPLFAEFLTDTTEGKETLKNYRSFVLDKLIQDSLILKKMEEFGLAIKEKEIEARLDRIIDNTKEVKNKKELAEHLEQNQQGMADFKEEIYRKIAREKVKKRIVSDVSVKSEKIEDFYKKNKESFRDKKGEIQPLKEVKDVIRERLLATKKEKVWNEWLSQVIKQASVERYLN